MSLNLIALPQSLGPSYLSLIPFQSKKGLQDKSLIVHLCELVQVLQGVSKFIDIIQ